jgi:transcriptional regulator with XRE-family HTH domain
MQLETIGEIIRVLRSRLGIEQVELARACGWQDGSPVSRIEKNRIHPTRRTLIKLAENLAYPSITGTFHEVRGWLFLAAGILPTAREVDALGDRIPAVDSLWHPATVIDFGWYVWRANEWFAKGLGLPDRHIGRNYLEMFFEDGGSVRRQLGELWPAFATILIEQFREETVRRREQRWFVTLMATLRTLPDFENIWNNAGRLSEGGFGWSQAPVDGGLIGTIRSHMAADPRFIVGQIVPQDVAGRNLMSEYGAIPRNLGARRCGSRY